MYFWKCWRDSRSQFIAGLIILVAICGIFTVAAARFGGPESIRTGAAPSVAQAWSSAAEVVLRAWASLLIIVWGFALGSTGLGNEFEGSTADFLFTRPRRRRYWVWAGWTVGVLELSGVVFAAVVTTFALLSFLTGQVYTWRLMITIPTLAIGGAVVYGLTYFMTVVARSGRQGLSYAIGIFLIALLLAAVLGHYWKIEMPSVMGFMMTSCKWAAGVAKSFPSGGMILWIVVALVFPLAAQALVESTEV